MGEQRDLADGRIACEILQQVLERVTRIGRALAIIAIGEERTARRPGEQHRHDIGVGIMDDLGEAVDRILEAVVETVDEHHHPALRYPRNALMQARQAGLGVELVDLERNEIGFGIAGKPARPLHLADFAATIRRQRDRHLDISRLAALAGEQHAGIGIGRARRRHQHGDFAGARHGRGDRRQHALHVAGAAGDENAERYSRETPSGSRYRQIFAADRHTDYPRSGS